MEEECLLTFELNQSNDELHVFTDEKGLQSLIENLTALLDWSKNGKTEHIHLMTEEWGGHELSSKSQSGKILNHVKFYCLNKK